MPNSIRRSSPEQGEDDLEMGRNPNLPENDGAGMANGRVRDENSLSFRHFLQPHSDVVPLPAPTRSRNIRGAQAGSVDLVDVTMALPDFVQDHLVMESLSGENESRHQHMQHNHNNGSSLDYNVLHQILPDFGTSQRVPMRVPQQGRRSIPDRPSGDAESGLSHGSVALPDFLSDGPMQLNQNDSNSPSSSAASRGNRVASMNASFPEEPVRGPSFDSNESMRLELDRLRRELSEKNRRLSQVEAEVARLRTGSLERSLRAAERNVAEANKRASEAEKQSAALSKELNRLKLGNGHNGTSNTVAGSSQSCLSNGLDHSSLDADVVLEITKSSEVLVSQLMQQLEELKRIASRADAQPQPLAEKKSKDAAKKSQQ